MIQVIKQGIKKSLLVVDMPKGSYNNINKAEKNAKLIIKKNSDVTMHSNDMQWKTSEYIS